MAFTPDVAVLRAREISVSLFWLYSYYCMKRNRVTGGFPCPNKMVATETGVDRSLIHRWKLKLIEKKWIEVDGDFVRPLVGFSTVPGDSQSQNGDSQSQNGDSQSQHVMNTSQYQPITSQLTSHHGGGGMPFDSFAPDDAEEITLVDDLLKVFPQLSGLGKKTKDEFFRVQTYAMERGAKPGDFSAWRDWLLKRWEKANASPEKFLETFHQFQAQRPRPAQEPDAPAKTAPEVDPLMLPILSVLRYLNQIKPEAIETWFEPLRVESAAIGGELVLRVPDEVFIDWINSNYQQDFSDAVTRIGYTSFRFAN